MNQEFMKLTESIQIDYVKLSNNVCKPVDNNQNK